MDPVIFGFRASQGPQLASALRNFDTTVAEVGGSPVRHFVTGDCGYVVATEVPSWGEVKRVAEQVDIEVLGAARLVLDSPTEGEHELLGVLPQDINEPIDLPRLIAGQLGDDPGQMGPEKLVCKRCGGIGMHYSPPCP
jgi:acetyl-CoA carboxylase carboxyltransferase component